MAHATLSPSSAHRWTKCPGSVALSAGLPDTPSRASEEGTAAHELAAMCLTQGKAPEAFLGRRIAVELDTFEVDADMVQAVGAYVQAIDFFTQGREHPRYIEQEVPLQFFTGEDGAQGTADAIVISGDELQVHDYKHGRGVEVFAEENTQLLLYALGALTIYGLLHEIDKVRLVIHQPRIKSGPDEWTLSVEELKSYAGIFRRAAILAMDDNPTAHLTPGESQCQWCRAKHVCPALEKAVVDATGVDFDDLTGKQLPVQRTPLARHMGQVELVEMWCRGVRSAVEQELLAGNEVPGWKLVQGRQGNRAWVDESLVEAALKSARIPSTVGYVRKLFSPTQAEKALATRNPRVWVKLEALISRAKGAAHVAPESDPRPALPMEDFEDISKREGE